MRVAIGIVCPVRGHGLTSFRLVMLLLVVLFWRQATGPHPLSAQRLDTSSQMPADTSKIRLERVKLAEEIQKLRIENRNTRRSLVGFLYSNGSVITAVALGFLGLLQFVRERKEELQKREDERFEHVVEALGGERGHQRIGAAVLLPTFLRAKYDRFYIQVFNLAAGHLRALPSAEPESAASVPAAGAGAAPAVGAVAALSVTGENGKGTENVAALRQALVTVFQDAYPLARATLADRTEPQHTHSRRYLNAEGVQLDNSFLAYADFRAAWLRNSSFLYADLTSSDFADAVLEQADFSNARLAEANLKGANLISSRFIRAALNSADLSAARLDESLFREASLIDVTMSGGTAFGVDFTFADLTRATFRNVRFANPEDTRRANIERADKLEGTRFENCYGLTQQQIQHCIARGAVVIGDGESATAENASAHEPPVSLAPPLLAHDIRQIGVEQEPPGWSYPSSSEARRSYHRSRGEDP